MTDVSARIRVKETHGIRRFLYPLHCVVFTPPPALPLVLFSADGQPIPTQTTPQSFMGVQSCRIDLAVSLAPFEAIELLLSESADAANFDDPLHISDGEIFVNTQKRLKMAFGSIGGVHQIVYDGVSHLRERSSITLNGSEVTETIRWSKDKKRWPPDAQINALIYAQREHSETRRIAVTTTQITACKSWATVTYNIGMSKPGDEIAFALPLAVKAKTLLCDFGAGGGIYGKLDAQNPEIVWKTNFDADGKVTWTLENGGRIDYAGEAASREEYLPQRWFHVIDKGKALAAAITKVPEACETLTVTLSANGDVRVAFTMGEKTATATTCGVCWHFLNDVPAIAAATNPQSILLPPSVEVLPA